MQINDFVDRVRKALDTKRNSYVDKLIVAPAADHDKLMGTIRAYSEIKGIINAEARRFLIEEEAQ